jgi:hypothetical protein
LPSDKQAAPAAPSSGTKPFALSLAEFKLTGGRVHIADELPASPYQKTLQDLHVSLRQLRLPRQRAGCAGFRLRHRVG